MVGDGEVAERGALRKVEVSRACWCHVMTHKAEDGKARRIPRYDTTPRE